MQVDVHLLERLLLDRFSMRLWVDLCRLQLVQDLPYILTDIVERKLGDVASEELEDLFREVGECVLALLWNDTFFQHLKLFKVRGGVECWSNLEEQDLKSAQEAHEGHVSQRRHRYLSHLSPTKGPAAVKSGVRVGLAGQIPEFDQYGLEKLLLLVAVLELRIVGIFEPLKLFLARPLLQHSILAIHWLRLLLLSLLSCGSSGRLSTCCPSGGLCSSLPCLVAQVASRDGQLLLLEVHQRVLKVHVRLVTTVLH